MVQRHEDALRRGDQKVVDWTAERLNIMPPAAQGAYRRPQEEERSDVAEVADGPPELESIPGASDTEGGDETAGTEQQTIGLEQPGGERDLPQIGDPDIQLCTSQFQYDPDG